MKTDSKITALVADVVVTYREVTLPTKCPQCGVSFVAADQGAGFNLRERHLSEATYGARFFLDKEDPDSDGRCVFDPNDDYEVTLGFECANCAHVIATGAFKEPDAESQLGIRK